MFTIFNILNKFQRIFPINDFFGTKANLRSFIRSISKFVKLKRRFLDKFKILIQHKTQKKKKHYNLGKY